MGKGFQNFMSKKDFHPSAWWNLKKVWEAKEKKKLDEQKQEELRIQYEKEQEIMNNKALLGDEKAKLGLSFMYDAPTGMAKREEPKEEPKFEWQRKYNAPREEWAKGNDAIQDQPFGIQVRNVRCVKCHTWGHLNTDRECPMFNMSGNADNPGYANNPSDLLKELEKEKELEKADKKAKKDDDSDNECEPEEVRVEKIDQIQLIADMKEDHGFNFKKNILHNIRSDDVLTTLNSKTTTVDDVQALLKTLSGSARLRVLKKTYGKDSNEYKTEFAAIEAAKAAKKAKKDEKKAKKKEKKALSSKKIKQEPESESSSESEIEEDVKAKRPQQSNASKSKRRHSDSDDSDDDDRRRPQKSHHSNDRKHKKRRHDSDSDDNGSDYRRKRRRSQCYEKTATRSDRRERRDDRHDEYYRDRRDRRSRRSRSREHRR